MLVFWEERLVILATPKTGSTALATLLEPFASMVLRGPPGLRHIGARGYAHHVAPLLAAAGAEGFETFALMREPLDWLGSWYRYRRRPAIAGTERSTCLVDFDGFVTAWCSTQRPAFADVGQQSTFLTPDDAPAVTRIFRYEAMPAALAFLEARLERPLVPAQMNVSPAADLSLRAETLQTLLARHRAEFDLYSRLTP